MTTKKRSRTSRKTPTAPPINVQLALDDEDTLEKVFVNAVKSSKLATARITQIERLIESEGRVSMNCEAQGVTDFLNEGRYRGLIDLVEGITGKKKKTANAAYFMRLEIERALGYESVAGQLSYGSLNVGNYGCREYGPYCMVLNRAAIEDRLSFTLKDTYVYASSSVMGGGISATSPTGERAVWRTVSRLVVAKLQDMLSHMAVYDLPTICRAITGWSDTIEAQIFGPILCSDIAEARVPAALLAEVMYLGGLPKRRPEQETFLELHETALNSLEQNGIRVRSYLAGVE